IDGDGTHTFVTDDIPTGDYAFKVALDEAWTTSYPAADVPFSVTTGDTVTFTYVSATNAVTVDVGDEPPDPEDVALARHSLRDDLTDEVFYFVLPDRFANGSTANDTGGLSGGKLAHGYDPADKGFYHGGDMRGLIDRLDYLEGMGVNAIWMAPLFKNRPVQGSGADASAGYHGYWITDFTQLDPHFGTNEELRELVDGAHARGIKVFFDVITNHTADVIDYAEGTYDYVSKAEEPYWDADGLEFDDADYAGSDDFPELNLQSFPYSPVFPTAADETVKVPAWLNDRTMYHNRGNSTFVGENALYGDFFGLDDLFTERPEVVEGMIDIFSDWVTDVGIDGYRIDTVKHVNDEFWQEWAPALVQHAASEGIDDFFMFGEVFDSNPAFTSHYTKDAKLQAVLDFPFQSRARSFASGSSTTGLEALFADDDYYTDADSNAYSLPTFLGNHDMGRIGNFLRTDNPGAADAELLARDVLAHSLMYLARGLPVVYYGDEQGFTGDGGDKDARQDMFPSQVGSYNDDDLIGTDATTADSNFDPTHPLYQALADLAELRADHRALREGAQIHRYAAAAPGVYAFSRILHDEQLEYVVALNNAETPQSVQVPTYSSGMGFTSVFGGGAAATTDASGRLTLTVPALSAVVYRAASPLAPSTRNPIVTLTEPAEGAEVVGNV
ncbi:MAG TPA: alpha-amylase family glycosyl hydrolase, partial [Desertimonas sp.]|nr:alpha-amylase family glycosyl hydrolase [Desertimonas sp.]